MTRIQLSEMLFNTISYQEQMHLKFQKNSYRRKNKDELWFF
jgi:hypothetical protein